MGGVLHSLGEESGGFHLTGASSNGKSTALAVAASSWGVDPGSWRTQRMIEAYPERRMQGQNLWNFFPIEASGGEFFDEDFSFCNLWRDIGGEILVDLNIRISHWKLVDVAGPRPLAAVTEQKRRAAA